MEEKKDKKNIKDLVIKIVLIIIIIILLVHNCMVIRKKGKERIPTGNVNIIEIICEKDTNCDVIPVNGDDNNTGNVKTNDETGNNGSGTTTGGGNNQQGDDDELPVIDEPDDELYVRDKRIVWHNTSQINLFSDSIYSFEDKIAPEDSNTYQFVVKNSTNYNLRYKISFTESNTHNMNLKYKLKKNGTYIIDHYVSYDELNISNQLLNANTNDTYYLDWKWISSDNDTEVGSISANYQLKISVEAESTNG